jgi:GT2 family glycosyltransferase
VVGNEGFWHRYQSAASKHRARQYAEGLYFSGSSQNLMVSSAAFETCGGFDAAYRTYGFEDRDLQLRIAQYGRIAWSADASVRHMDALSMVTVSGKMIEAGGPSAVLFARRHPEAYRQLGYAALDARTHRWMRLPARLLGYLIEPMARAVDRMIAMPILPYALKSSMVKILSALSFLVGTAR